MVFTITTDVSVKSCLLLRLRFGLHQLWRKNIRPLNLAVAFFLQLTWHQMSLWHCGHGHGVQRRGVYVSCWTKRSCLHSDMKQQSESEVMVKTCPDRKSEAVRNIYDFSQAPQRANISQNTPLSHVLQIPAVLSVVRCIVGMRSVLGGSWGTIGFTGDAEFPVSLEL